MKDSLSTLMIYLLQVK